MVSCSAVAALTAAAAGVGPAARAATRDAVPVEAPAAADGMYDWSVSDVIGKTVLANIKHYKEPWVNREGVEVMLDKCKVSEFLLPDTKGGKIINPEDVAWDE